MQQDLAATRAEHRSGAQGTEVEEDGLNRYGKRRLSSRL